MYLSDWLAMASAATMNFELDQCFEETRQFTAFEFLSVDLNREIFRCLLQQKARHLAFIFDVLLVFALLDLEERGLRDIDAALIDQLIHLAIEERQQKRPNMRSIDIGIGHDDDFVIAQLGYIEILLTDTGTECCDHRHDFLVQRSDLAR